MRHDFARVLLVALVASVSFVNLASATVLTGPGGRGVPAGLSSLVGLLDFADTFTGTDNGGRPNRPYQAALQPAAAYAVENVDGHVQVNFQTQGQPAGVAAFSFAADSPANRPGLSDGVPTYPGSSGAGSATGFTQTGGGTDYGVPYGFRTRYVVQVDAVSSADRIDVGTGTTPGTIGVGNLTVFFRGDGSGNASLYNGVTDTPIQSQIPGFNTGLPASTPSTAKWHNYAVSFDQPGNKVELIVDEQSKGVINLLTFAGGIYANFSNASVSAGAGLGGGETRMWTDNFQVGAPVPEPATSVLFALGAAGLALVARRRRKS